MNYTFSKEDIELMSNIFQTKPEIIDNGYMWIITPQNYTSKFYFSLYTNIPPHNSNSISIQTACGYYELHNITSWSQFFSDEVVFFVDNDSHLSSVFVSKKYGISFYSNIDKNIFGKDINEIDPVLLLASMQLNIYYNYEDK